MLSHNFKKYFKYILISLACFVIIIIALKFLKGGYIKENGRWNYVTFDEAVGRRVEDLNADNATFVVLDNKNFAKDKYKVYFQHGTIDEADPKTFQVINSKYGYSKDANSVFVEK